MFQLVSTCLVIIFFAEIEEVQEDEDLQEDYTATQSFLRYLEYPPDPTVNIDLEQAAVIIMSHLDRLAQKYQPNSPAGLLTDHESRQKVIQFDSFLTHHF